MKSKIILSTLTLSLAAATTATISSCVTSQKAELVNDVQSSNDEPTFVTPETDPDKPTFPEVKQPETEKPSGPYGRAEEVLIHYTSREGQEGVEWIGSQYARIALGRQFCAAIAPDAMRKGYHVEYWLKKTETGYEEIKPTDIITEDMLTDGVLDVFPFFQSDVELKNCLALSALSDSTVSIVNHGTAHPNLSYSYNGINWYDYYESTEEQGRTSLDVKSGEVVYFRGRNYEKFSTSESNYTSFSVGGSINLYGNVMTLIDDGQGKTLTIPCSHCFYKLFDGCAGISSISSNFLPAENLADYCYAYMFDNCVGITAFPSSLLPATTLSCAETTARGTGAMCYTCMFQGCTGIKAIPHGLLPATTLSTYCYYGMFSGCTGLTNLDDDNILPATELKYGCYYGMFALCSGLTHVNNYLLYPTVDGARVKPRLATRCYGSLFASCTGLVDMSGLELPVDDLSAEPIDQPGEKCAKCYEEMFFGCTKMTIAPVLYDATAEKGRTLGPQCYYSMFYNCFALQTAPVLGAAVAEVECYMNMFHNCDTLSTIPELGTTTLAVRCYKGMFTNCDGLGDLHEKTLPALEMVESCYENMFQASTVTISPSIAATSTAKSCCRHMFYKCVKLTESPELKATNATAYCYYEMFRWCEKLTTCGNVALSSGTNADYCCYIMFGECSSLDVEEDGDDGDEFISIGDWGTDCRNNMCQNTVNYHDSGTGNQGTWWLG